MYAISGTPLVAFVGARGGVGTSTLAATCALLAAEQQQVALIDGSARNGLELLLGRDDHAGPFWQDLMSATHTIADRAVNGEGDLTVMAWRSMEIPSDQVVTAAIDALARTHPLLIADVGTASSSMERLILARASAIALLVPGELRPITHGAHLVPLLSQIAPTHLVVCEPSPTGVSADELADLLNLPLAAVMQRDSRIPLRGEHSQLPTRSLRTTGRNIITALAL